MTNKDECPNCGHNLDPAANAAAEQKANAFEWLRGISVCEGDHRAPMAAILLYEIERMMSAAEDEAVEGDHNLVLSLEGEIDSLAEGLSSTNEVLRSAKMIADRNGIETNWEAFRKRVISELDKHAALNVRPLTASEFRVGDT